MVNLCISLFAIVLMRSYASASSADCIGICPPNYPDDDVILLPHENCSYYCSCVYGHAVEMPCPQGLHFSVEDRTCTFPAIAKCEPEYQTVPPSTTVKSKSTKPPNNWPTDAFPAETKLETEHNELFTHQHPDCLGKCPLRNFKGAIVLVEHRECSKYCKCNKWLGAPKDCPPGLHFSLEYDGCVVPALARCSRYIPPPTPKPCPCALLPKKSNPDNNGSDSVRKEGCIPPNHPKECLGNCPRWNDPDNVVHIPHIECTKFCKCDNGKPCLFVCPFNLHFNPDKQVCDYPPAANCTGIGRVTFSSDESSTN